ncbi:hypothetical protein GQ42DRAFT_181314 [Ramicandelaber brevisporus]|nr:hypothetical protein GQ42DRAFT_181314 [Ramicandelaber brevisporus]
MAAIGSSGGGNNSSSDSSNDSRLNIRQRWSRRTMGVLRDQSSEDGHDRPDFGEEAVLAVSSNARFIAVANNDNDSNNSKHAAVYDCNSGMDVIWSTLARGESCFDEDEIVTSMAFMTVYSPPSPASKFLADDADVPQIVLLCGYSSGLMRVFSAENGDLLLSADLQPKPSTPSASQPHDHSVRAIRYYYSRRHDGSDLEHDMVTALIGDSGNVVCIDGHTLWVALRLGLSGSPPELDQETHLTIDRHVTISHFQLSSSSHQHHSRNKRQQTVLDCAVVDLIRPAGLHPLSKLPLNSLHSTNSSRLRKTAECDRTYIAAGSHPSLAVYMHADSRNVWNARAALARTAKRVTSAVVSTASSYLPNRAMYYLPRRLKQVAASPPPASSNQETLESPYASPIQRTSVFADSGRHISRLLILPQLAADSEQQFAVTSDNLGRVLLIDVRDGLVVRIWKGLRDAEVSAAAIVASFTSVSIFITIAVSITVSINISLSFD